MIVELVGGPLDGRERPQRNRPGRYLFVVAASDAARAPLTFYKMPRDRSAMYRKESEYVAEDGQSSEPRLVYFFVGYQLLVCEDCEAVYSRDQMCFCGQTHKARTK